ncbi:MAG: tetratricopeptide repeat protein [Aggregatilineales bacterium]
MGRLCCIFILLLVLPLAALAQGEVIDPADRAEIAAGRAEAAADRAEAAVGEAQRYAEEAGRSIELASNLLNLFEALAGVSGILIPLLAVVAAIVGLSRLNNAQRELEEARHKIESELATARAQFDQEMAARRDELERLARQMDEEMAERRAELNDLNALLGRSIRKQQRRSARATLALALLPLGERQYRAQDLKGARETYERALQLDPRNPVIHYRIGYVAVQSDQFDDAVHHFERALEIDPDFPLAQAALGFTFRRLADKTPEGIERETLLNQAEAKFLAALKSSPKLVDDDGESWWGSLGGLYRRRGQLDQAIHAYEQAALVTPHSSYPFSNLALLYMQKQNRSAMLEKYRRVERLARAEMQAEVDNYWAYADLITALLAQNKVNEIDDLLTAFFDIAPTETLYPLESLVDTLSRLLAALGGAEAAAHIPPYIERTQAEIAARRAALASEQLN